MKLLLLIILITAGGCQTRRTFEMYLQYHPEAGDCDGWVKSQGQITRIHVEPYEPPTP